MYVPDPPARVRLFGIASSLIFMSDEPKIFRFRFVSFLGLALSLTV